MIGDISILLNTIANFLAQASPFILAAIGGLISEWAGLLNIGLEGIMLAGAFAAIAGSSLVGGGTLGFFLGLFTALVSGLTLGALMALVSEKGKANIFIVGLAINLLASGIVSFSGSLLFGTRSVISQGAAQVTNSFLSTTLFAVCAVVIPITLWIWSTRFRSGLRLRVLGTNNEMLTARGINTSKMRVQALLASGLFAGLAGAILSLRLGAFVPNQSAGKGWIALVLIFVGTRHPLGILVACLLYSGIEGATSAAQAGQAHPALLVGTPFLLVLAGLIIVQALRQWVRGRRAKRAASLNLLQ